MTAASLADSALAEGALCSMPKADAEAKSTLMQSDRLCRLHVHAMTEVFASYDLLVSLSKHSDVAISGYYADTLLVGSLTHLAWDERGAACRRGLLRALASFALLSRTPVS